MAAKAPSEIRDVRVDDLRLDNNNPRVVGEKLASEDEMIAYLNEYADIEELLLSMIVNGYLDFEPLIVQRDTNIVLEGNRRVAALKLIRDKDLRNRLSIRLPEDPSIDAKPEAVRALIVANADEARQFIGFKHINGPQKWDAMSKAKYAADWHSSGAPIEHISRALGDTYNTVSRLIYGFQVYKQALDDGFDPNKRTAKRFAFSHLYTAITRSSIRNWLDLNEEEAAAPVPNENLGKLRQLMSWLYGQGSAEPAVVRTQNPDLNRLADVLEAEGPRDTLIETRSLDAAWEELEPRSERLDRALRQAVRQSETASALIGSYDGRESTYDLGQNLFRTARSIAKTLKDERDRREDLFDE